MTKTKCQICEGRGIVPLGFYETCEELDRSKVETCKACLGVGWEIEVNITTEPFVIKDVAPQPYVYPRPYYQQPPWWTYTTWIGGDIDFGEGSSNRLTEFKATTSSSTTKILTVFACRWCL